MNLRPHQSRALEAMNGANKGKILIPTGGGKTVIFSHIAEQAAKKGNRVCIRSAKRNSSQKILQKIRKT